jgi:hypothetical protein
MKAEKIRIVAMEAAIVVMAGMTKSGIKVGMEIWLVRRVVISMSPGADWVSCCPAIFGRC